MNIWNKTVKAFGGREITHSKDGQWAILTTPWDIYYSSPMREVRYNGKTIQRGHMTLKDAKGFAELNLIDPNL